MTRGSQGRARLGVATAIAVLASSACAGRLSSIREPTRPVPTEIVPTTLPGESLTLQLDRDPAIHSAFGQAGALGLSSDGDLWQIHAGTQLVGALQLATLKTRVNPARAADRDTVISQVLPGTPERIDLNGLPVWTLPTAGSARAIFLWFGTDIFGVLQLKANSVDSDKVAGDLITELASQPAWPALPPEAYIEKPPKD